MFFRLPNGPAQSRVHRASDPEARQYKTVRLPFYIGIYRAARFVTSGLMTVLFSTIVFNGALSAALAAIVRGVPWTFDTHPAYLLSLAYLAVFGSIIAFGAYLTLLKRVGGGPAAFVGVTTPVIALALSTLFEGYHWTWVAALGVVLAVTGNWLALRPGHEDTTK
jgi:drug/metabolite transporter (DMT)-like permease